MQAAPSANLKQLRPLGADIKGGCCLAKSDVILGEELILALPFANVRVTFGSDVVQRCAGSAQLSWI